MNQGGKKTKTKHHQIVIFAQFICIKLKLTSYKITLDCNVQKILQFQNLNMWKQDNYLSIFQGLDITTSVTSYNTLLHRACASYIKRFCFSLCNFIWIKHEARRYPAEPHISKYIFVICHYRSPPGDTYDTFRFNTVEKIKTFMLKKKKITSKTWVIGSYPTYPNISISCD